MFDPASHMSVKSATAVEGHWRGSMDPKSDGAQMSLIHKDRVIDVCTYQSAQHARAGWASRACHCHQ